MDTVYANTTVSVTELKRNYASIIKETDGLWLFVHRYRASADQHHAVTY